MANYKLYTFHGQQPIGSLVDGSEGKMKFVATKNEWLQLVTASMISPTQYLHCENEDINMKRPITLRELIQWLQKGDLEL
jgi:hypothetical protein